MTGEASLTSSLYWNGALSFGVVDVALVSILLWRVRAQRFRRMKWEIGVVSGLFWAIFAAALVLSFWDSYYEYIRPPWGRWATPLLALPIYSALGLAFWWLAQRLPGPPVAGYCLLAGIEALAEHLIGIYRMGILEKVPMLRGISPVSVLVFSVFEYILYWGIVLALAGLANRTLQRGKRGESVHSGLAAA